MVGNPLALRQGGLGGANIHTAVKEARIGRDDLAIEAFRQLKRKLRFTNGGGANKH
jgi:hypothetical protein